MNTLIFICLNLYFNSDVLSYKVFLRIAYKNPKNKVFSSILSLIFRVFLLCVIKARSISLKISPQSCDVGALFQSLNALPHHIVQFHTEHLAALADYVTVYAGGKGFGLKFLFERFQFQI